MSENGGFVLESSCWSNSCSSSCSEDDREGGGREVGQKRERDVTPDDLYCIEDAEAWDDYGPLDRAPFTQEQDLSQQ